MSNDSKIIICARSISGVAVAILIAIFLSVEGQAQDTGAIVAFQRAADSYAFLHRQVERKLGEGVSDSELATALRQARPDVRTGDLFGSEIAAVLRGRIASAFRADDCKVAIASKGSDGPRFNQQADSASPLPPCVADALPKLPAELEYRSIGQTLLLVDAHANLIVDVLEDAFSAAK